MPLLRGHWRHTEISKGSESRWWWDACILTPGALRTSWGLTCSIANACWGVSLKEGVHSLQIHPGGCLSGNTGAPGRVLQDMAWETTLVGRLKSEGGGDSQLQPCLRYESISYSDFGVCFLLWKKRKRKQRKYQILHMLRKIKQILWNWAW